MTAPEPVRAPLRKLASKQRIRACAALRPGLVADPVLGGQDRTAGTARRWQVLQAEIDDLDTQLTPLVTAGDNRDRLRSEASFAPAVRCCSDPRLIRAD